MICATSYVNGKRTLPEAPFKKYLNANCNGSCFRCNCLNTWWDRFKYTVDDLLSRSNVHTCTTSVKSPDEKKAKKQGVGCINKYGNCKARFPRQTYNTTQVDPETGAST